MHPKLFKEYLMVVIADGFLDSALARRLSIILVVISVVLAPVMFKSLPSCINGELVNGECVCKGPAYTGLTCSEITCMNGIPDEMSGGCECANLWHGEKCDTCNAQANMDSGGPCLLPCFSNSTVLFYGEKCEKLCKKDMVHGECTSSGPVCDADHYGLSCEHTCVGGCPENHVCEFDTIEQLANCVCAPGFYGPECLATCGPLNNTCSGHGICNDGTCICSSDFYRGELCEKLCPGDPTYGEVCSGHGACAAVGDNATCQCEEGWEWSTCLCNEDITCASNGLCKADESGCSCVSGYTEASDCRECAEGFVKDASGLCTPCSCSGHGACAVFDDGVQCVCDDGWSGESCGACNDGYYGENCDIQCNSAKCNNRGSCNQNGECVCVDGFDHDTDCRDCSSAFYPKRGADKCSQECSCNGHGTCDAFGNCNCEEPFTGRACIESCTPQCAAHGTCIVNEDAADVFGDAPAYCRCDEGYFGLECSFTSPHYNDQLCGGNGVPVLLDLADDCDNVDSATDSFCAPVTHPFGDLDENCRSEYFNIASYDWHSFCVDVIESVSPAECVAECGAECSCGDTVCAEFNACENGDDNDALCGEIVNEVNCVADPHCKFVNGACKGKQCTDVRAPLPASDCLPFLQLDKETYLEQKISQMIHGNDILPVPAPIKPFSSTLYNAGSDTPCNVYDLFENNGLKTSNYKYFLHCLLDGTREQIYDLSTPRAEDCFVEREASEESFPRPDDYDIWTSVFEDCERADLAETCASDPNYTRIYIDADAPGVQFFARDASGKALRVSGGVVTVDTTNILKIPTPYMRVEIFNENSIVINDVSMPVSGPFTSMTAQEIRRIDAYSKECARKIDQVADYTNYTEFTSDVIITHDQVCTSFGSTGALARCGLKYNTPLLNNALPETDVLTAIQCFKDIEPWKICSQTCIEGFQTFPQHCDDCSIALNVTSTFEYCSKKAHFNIVPYDLDVNAVCKDALAQVVNDDVANACLNIVRQTGASEKKAACECNAGFSGAACEINCPIENGLTCAGNGECHAIEGATLVSDNGGVFLESGVPVMGTCDCERGSGSTCAVPCDDCNTAAYTLRQSQRAICNEGSGQCETMPPGIVMNYSLSNATAGVFDSAGRLSSFENLQVLPVKDIVEILSSNLCRNESIEVQSLPNSDLNNSAVLKLDETSGDPYSFLPQAPDGFEQLQNADWEWFKNSPKTINTSIAVFSGSFPFQRSTIQTQCLDSLHVSTYNYIYPIAKRILQMQGNFNVDTLQELHTHTSFAYATVSERVWLPEYVDFAFVELPPSMEGRFKGYVELFPNNNAYVVDLLWQGVGLSTWEGPFVVNFGDSKIIITNSTINNVSMGFTLNKATRFVFKDLSVFINMFDDTDAVTNFKIDIEESELYRGRSGFCGFKAEHECPALVTDFKVPCSGRGLCSRSSCTCTCDVTPEAVLKNGIITSLEDATDFSPYRGAGCEKTCPGYDGHGMSSVCSGHGTCNLNAQCECIDGFVGENCEFKCPSLNSFTCNNHGGCYVATIDLTSVNAFNRNALEALTEENVVKTVTFAYESAVNDDDFNTQSSDNVNTTYFVDKSCKYDGNEYLCATCDCDTRGVNGLGKWTGGVCSQCAHDAYGPHCNLACPDCGAFGTCDYGIDGSGTCLCGNGNKVVKSDGKVFERTERDDTVFLKHVGNRGVVCSDPNLQTENACPQMSCTFADNACTGGGEGFNFDFSSPICNKCMHGFSGSTCSHNTLPCLFGGHPVYSPFYDDECTCLSPIYDPQNHCCPFNYKLTDTYQLYQHALDLTHYSLNNIESWTGENGMCKMCPLYQDGIPITDSSVVLDNVLKYVPNVCDGRAECIIKNGDTMCDCENAGLTVQTICPNGQFNYGHYGVCNERIDCRDCIKGTFLTYAEGEAAKTTCDMCPAGKYNNQVGQATCKSCPAGYYTNQQNSYGCTACAKGKYQSESGQTACENCQPGKYNSQTGRATCKNCPKGYYNTQHASHGCTACQKGKYQSESGQTSCKLCVRGSVGTKVAHTVRYCDGYVNLNIGPDVSHFREDDINYPPLEGDPEPCFCGTQCYSGNCDNCGTWEGNCQGCRATVWDALAGGIGVGKQFCVDCLSCVSETNDGWPPPLF